MKFNLTAKSHISLQTALVLAQLANQYLLPAFFHISNEQKEALTGFISAVQLLLGCKAVYTNPDGTPISKETK